MNYFLTLIELWVLLLLSSLIGRRIVDFLPQAMKPSIGFYVSPLLGTAFLVIIATFYGWLLPFQFVYTLFLVAGLAFFSFFSEKNPKEWGRYFLQYGLFATLCSLPVLAPLLHYQGYNPFTDIFTYLAQSQWLQTHAFSEKAVASGYYPTLTQIVLYQKTGSRMGGTFLLGFVQSLFHLRWSYDAYLATVSLGFVTGCLAIGGVIKQVVPLKKIMMLALALLPAFSLNGFVFGAEWGFYPQTMGLAFAAGLAALLPFSLDEILKKESDWFKAGLYILPTSICSAALLLAYNEPFPIFLLALLLFVVIAAWMHPGKMKLIASFLGLYFIETLFFINYEAIRMAKNLIQTLTISKGAVIGWPVLWSPVQFLAHAFGMKSAFSNGLYHFDYILSHIVFPFIFVILIVGLIRFLKSKPKCSMTIIFLFCVDLILLLFFIKFRYFSPNATPAEVGYTFLQFKIAKYATPFSLALAGIGLAIVWEKYQKYHRYFIAVYLIAMIMGLFFQCVPVAKAFHQNFVDETKQKSYPFNRLLAMREAVSTIPQDEVIYLAMEGHDKLRQMVAYVLYDRKIASDYRDDGYLLGNLPEQDRVMQPDQAKWLLSLDVQENQCMKYDKVIGPFTIQAAPFHEMIFQKQTGGYNTETNVQGEIWNWVRQVINFDYLTLGSINAVKFTFKLQTFPFPRKGKVTIKNTSGKLLGEYKLSKRQGDFIFETPWIESDSNKFTLHVEVDGKPVRISSGDSREASFVIANVRGCVR